MHCDGCIEPEATNIASKQKYFRAVWMTMVRPISKKTYSERYVCMSAVVLQILMCHARHWMYSKSWIEDYRVEIKYGLPSQRALAEYSLETHKIGVVQREDEKSLDEGGYDYRESSTIFATRRSLAVCNKGDRFEGRLISDLITVPRNVTHVLPSLRVDIVLLERASEEAVNFIGLLDSPISDGYSSFSESLRHGKKNASVSYEFLLCGNYLRNDTLSIGYMHVHLDGDSTIDRSIAQDASVIDPYLFMVVIRSLAVNGTSLATCGELNARGAIFDNTVPGIYLPFAIYTRFMRVIHAHATEHDFPRDMKIWERRTHACYDGPVAWMKIIPEMSVSFFAREDEAFEVSYTGDSLVQRYYTEDSEETTYCYIFAIRRGGDEHLVFGRAAFEGVRLIFNRTGKVLSFLENDCCGPDVTLRRVMDMKKRMSSCLPENLRTQLPPFDISWIWIFVIIIVIAVLTCILSAPRPLNRGSCPPPSIHIFIPQTGTCATDRPEKSVDTAEQ